MNSLGRRAARQMRAKARPNNLLHRRFSTNPHSSDKSSHQNNPTAPNTSNNFSNPQHISNSVDQTHLPSGSSTVPSSDPKVPLTTRFGLWLSDLFPVQISPLRSVDTLHPPRKFDFNSHLYHSQHPHHPHHPHEPQWGASQATSHFSHHGIPENPAEIATMSPEQVSLLISQLQLLQRTMAQGGTIRQVGQATTNFHAHPAARHDWILSFKRWVFSYQYLSIILGSGVGIVFVIGTSYLIYGRLLEDRLSKLAIDLTESTIRSNQTHTSVLQLTETIIHDEQVMKNLQWLFISLVQDPMIQDVLISTGQNLAIEHILKNPEVQAQVTELLLVLFQNPVIQKQVADLVKYVISRQDIQEQLVGVCVEALKDSDLQNQTTQSLVTVWKEFSGDPETFQAVRQLLESVLNDQKLIEGSSQMLWKTVKSAFWGGSKSTDHPPQQPHPQTRPQPSQHPQHPQLQHPPEPPEPPEPPQAPKTEQPTPQPQSQSSPATHVDRSDRSSKYLNYISHDISDHHALVHQEPIAIPYSQPKQELYRLTTQHTPTHEPPSSVTEPPSVPLQHETTQQAPREGEQEDIFSVLSSAATRFGASVKSLWNDLSQHYDEQIASQRRYEEEKQVAQSPPQSPPLDSTEELHSHSDLHDKLPLHHHHHHQPGTLGALPHFITDPTQPHLYSKEDQLYHQLLHDQFTKQHPQSIFTTALTPDPLDLATDHVSASTQPSQLPAPLPSNPPSVSISDKLKSHQ